MTWLNSWLVTCRNASTKGSKSLVINAVHHDVFEESVLAFGPTSLGKQRPGLLLHLFGPKRGLAVCEENDGPPQWFHQCEEMSLLQRRGCLVDILHAPFESGPFVAR